MKGGALRKEPHMPCKVFLKILKNSQESTCARVPIFIKLYPGACNFIKKETGVFLALVFYCKLYEICKNTFFMEQLWRLLLIDVKAKEITGATSKFLEVLEKFLYYVSSHLCKEGKVI